MTPNLPERQTVALDGLGGQAALFEDPQQVMALSASELRMVGVEIAQAVRPRLAEMRRYVGLVAWAMRAKVPAGEYGKWAEGYAEMVGISIRTLGEWRSKVEAVNPYQSPRKSAGQSTQLAETAETSKPILAASTEAPAKPSEGVAQTGETPAEPTVATPSGPSSGGARTTAPPRLAPTDEAPTSSSPAPLDRPGSWPAPDPSHHGVPLDPEEIIERDFGGTMLRGPRKYIDECKLIPLPPEHPPSDRQLAARVFAAMREIEPTDAGPVTTPEEATFLRQWAQRTLDAWKAKHVPPAPAEKPQRRQGTITRPSRLPSSRPEDWTEIGPVDRPLRLPSVPTPIAPYSPPRTGKRHADDCRCLSCVPPKAVAK